MRGHYYLRLATRPCISQLLQRPAPQLVNGLRDKARLGSILDVSRALDWKGNQRLWRKTFLGSNWWDLKHPIVATLHGSVDLKCNYYSHAVALSSCLLLQMMNPLNFC